MEILTKHSTANNPVLKIVAAILFIALPIIGFALGLQYQAIVNNSNQYNIIPLPTPTPAPKDETANWKKYTNSTYGYSFSYPRTWFIKNFINVGSGKKLDAEYLNDNATVDTEMNQRISAILINNIDKVDINVNGSGAKTEVTPIPDIIAGIKIEKDIIIQTVYKDKNDTLPAGTMKWYYVSIPFKSFLLELRSSLQDKDILDQILSTFKFLDQK